MPEKTVLIMCLLYDKWGSTITPMPTREQAYVLFCTMIRFSLAFRVVIVYCGIQRVYSYPGTTVEKFLLSKSVVLKFEEIEDLSIGLVHSDMIRIKTKTERYFSVSKRSIIVHHLVLQLLCYLV